METSTELKELLSETGRGYILPYIADVTNVSKYKLFAVAVELQNARMETESRDLKNQIIELLEKIAYAL